MKRVFVWGILAVLVSSAAAGMYFWGPGHEEPGLGRAAGFFRKGRKARPVTVELISPEVQTFERRAIQPGSLAPFESVELHSETSGMLKTLKVDIGDRVKQGDVLAEIDVPEVRKQKAKAEAQKALAQARVTQTNKALKRAEADRRVARAAVPQAKAQLDAVKATLRYRSKQHQRIMDLWESKAVEERLVDESEERKEAAASAARAGELALETARAQDEAADAKVDQARADIAEAEANVAIAEAEIARIEVLLAFARIVAPFQGQVTRRNVYPGAYVRSAREGGTVPLLSLERTDKLRVVVQIPDRDVPYADVGDKATVEIDSLGGKAYQGTISRTQGAEDTLTRTMRVEIDLDNRTGELRPGMFGKVSILLQKSARALTLPSACLVGEVKEGKGAVYVSRGGKAALVPITIGSENGLLVEVVAGLTDKDRVVRRANGPISPGTPVQPPAE